MRLFRITKEKDGIIGKLYLCDFSCWTIERDCKNLIPIGEYQIKLVKSEHFGDDSLWVCREPGVPYEKATMHNLIHSGNTIYDVSGCIAVGSEISTEGIDTISYSKKTLNELKGIIIDKLKGGENIILSIKNLRDLENV